MAPVHQPIGVPMQRQDRAHITGNPAPPTISNSRKSKAQLYRDTTKDTNAAHRQTRSTVRYENDLRIVKDLEKEVTMKQGLNVLVIPAVFATRILRLLRASSNSSPPRPKVYLGGRCGRPVSVRWRGGYIREDFFDTRMYVSSGTVRLFDANWCVRTGRPFVRPGNIRYKLLPESRSLAYSE